MPVRLLPVFATWIAYTAFASAQPQWNYNSIALSGFDGSTLGYGPNLGVGFEDTHFLGFGNASLNNSGQVSFRGSLFGDVDFTNDNGIWTKSSGSLTVIAREGAVGPGPNLGVGVIFSNLSLAQPITNDSGRLAFLGQVSGTGIVGVPNGIWTTTSGTLNVVALSDASGPGPNLGAGIQFSSVGGATGPVYNNAGHVAFSAFLSGAGVTSSNNLGIWTNVGGSLVNVARTGSIGSGPNLGSGVVFDGFVAPVLNGTGQVAFIGGLGGTGINSTNNNGIWSYSNGVLTLLARDGPTGPGPNLGAGVQFDGFNGLKLNNAGQIAFRGDLQGGGGGIWTSTGGTLTAIAVKGTAGPGPNLGAGVNFVEFFDPVFNATGHVAFRGVVGGTGVNATNDSGIWTNASGTLAVVARKGAAGPGPNLSVGVNFDSFSEPVMNAAGHVAFIATLNGTGVTGSNFTGLWTNSGGVLTKVVRTGDTFDVDPGVGEDLRIVTSIGFTSLSGEDGRALSFNDSGMLTFTLTFIDGSSGVFTAAPVPEPTSLLCFGAALGIVMLRISRKREKGEMGVRLSSWKSQPSSHQ